MWSGAAVCEAIELLEAVGGGGAQHDAFDFFQDLVGRLDRAAFEGTFRHVVTCPICVGESESESGFTGLPVGMEPVGVAGSVVFVAWDVARAPEVVEMQLPRRFGAAEVALKLQKTFPGVKFLLAVRSQFELRTPVFDVNFTNCAFEVPDQARYHAICSLFCATARRMEELGKPFLLELPHEGPLDLEAL
jgi:hypothetical protein